MVGPNPTSSPASSRRRSRIASRMKATPARGLPMLRVEMKPGATVRQCAPGRDFLQAVGERGEHQRMANHAGSMWPGNSRRRCVACAASASAR